MTFKSSPELLIDVLIYRKGICKNQRSIYQKL